MAPDRRTILYQLSLDDLVSELSQHPGEYVALPIYPADLGGELIDLLSRGLYTNPFDCVREYVQNSVDAGATEVTIKLTGHSVHIYDNGRGMSLQGVLDARKFGLSPKDFDTNVGFRGIGLYSAFRLCRQLRITTTMADDPNEYILRFDFAAIAQKIDAMRSHTTDERPDLLQLLSEHTFLQQRPKSLDSAMQGTFVELRDIGDVDVSQLSDRVGLRRYLLQHLPIDFSDEFPHKQEINKKLTENVPGYNPVTITLQSDADADELVAKYTALSVDGPQFGYLTAGPDHRQVAYYWYCRSTERERIDTDVPAIERPKYEGFVYKMKGFTIGDRNRLRVLWERMGIRGVLYTWCTGEIYVLDQKVIPKAERNDFESNAAKYALEMAVGNKFHDIGKQVEKFHERGVADAHINEARIGLDKVIAQADANPNQAFYALAPVIKELESNKSKASDGPKALAAELLDKARALQNKLQKIVEASSTEEDTAAPRTRAPNRKQVTSRPGGSTQGSGESALPARTVRAVLDDAGWEVDGRLKQFVAALQSTLDDTLVRGSTTYNSVIRDLESKVAGNQRDGG